MKSLIYGCGCISQGACLKWHSPSFLASRLRLPRVAVFVFFSFLFGFFFLWFGYSFSDVRSISYQSWFP